MDVSNIGRNVYVYRCWYLLNLYIYLPIGVIQGCFRTVLESQFLRKFFEFKHSLLYIIQASEAKNANHRDDYIRIKFPKNNSDPREGRKYAKGYIRVILLEMVKE